MTRAFAPAPRPGAWVTYLTGTSGSYLPGIFVLAHSLRQVGSRYPLIVGVDARQPERTRRALHDFGLETFEVETLAPDVAQQCGVAARFVDTFTKIRAWELTQFERVVLIDSDVLVRRNADELMTMVLPLDGAGIAGSHSCVCNKARSKWAPDDWREEFCPYSAPDQAISLSDASPRTHKLLNSGVVPLRPSRDTFDALVHHLSVSPNVAKWLCPDQDLMSDYFGVRGRLVLPLSFNAIKTARSWHPQHWQDDSMHIVHYIVDKPWDNRTPRDPSDAVTHGWWWDAFERMYELADGNAARAIQSLDLSPAPPAPGR